VGERHKVPGTELDKDSDGDDEHPEWWHAVVTDVVKTYTKMWLKDDDEKTRHKAQWVLGVLEAVRARP
jgi:hypothetical protein